MICLFVVPPAGCSLLELIPSHTIFPENIIISDVHRE